MMMVTLMVTIMRMLMKMVVLITGTDAAAGGNTRNSENEDDCDDNVEA
jgi:hypothetical protein